METGAVFLIKHKSIQLWRKRRRGASGLLGNPALKTAPLCGQGPYMQTVGKKEQ